MEDQTQAGGNAGNENSNLGTQGSVDEQGNKTTEKQPEPLRPGQTQVEPGTPSPEQAEFLEGKGYDKGTQEDGPGN